MTRLALVILSAVLASACAEQHHAKWRAEPTWRPAARAVVSGEIAERTRSGTDYAGGSIAAGYEILFPVDPAVNRTFYGEAMGIEARGHFLRSLGEDPDVWLVQAGAAFSSYKLFRGGALDRLRLPAFYPLLLPEIGAAFRPDEPASAYLRWSAPLAFLIHDNFALEVAPSVSLLGPAPKPNPDVLIALDFGLSFREIRPHYVESEGWDSWTTISTRNCFEDQWNRPELRQKDRLDLAPALPHRRYFAVTRVSPMAHHFMSADSPQNTRRHMFRAVRNAAGRVEVEWQASEWGDVPTYPGGLEPVPAELRSFAEGVEALVRKECFVREPLEIRYAGAYRDVVVEEFVVRSPSENPREPLGWRARHHVAMDEGLTRVLGSRGEYRAIGPIIVPKNAQWFPGSGEPAFELSKLVVLPEALASEVGNAARRFELGAPPAELASLLPADEPVIPPSLTAHLQLTVSLNFPLAAAPTSKAEVVTLSLTLRDAVFGPRATGKAESSTHEGYTIRATLTPAIPKPSLRHFRTEEYEGTLAVHVEDTLGRVWERLFPVSGSIELDRDGVLAPGGLSIPRGLPQSKEWYALSGTLPAKGKEREVHIFLDNELPQVEDQAVSAFP